MAKEVATQYLPFAVLRRTASIGIPQSYIVGVLKKSNGADAEPSAVEVEKQFQVEKQRVGSAAKNIIMARSDDDVTVDLYPDLASAVTVLADGTLAVASGMAADTDFVDTLKKYGPQGGLALLAATGLFMLAGARSYVAFHTGRPKAKVVPSPGRLLTSSSLPCSSTMRRAMARPRPAWPFPDCWFVA